MIGYYDATGEWGNTNRQLTPETERPVAAARLNFRPHCTALRLRGGHVFGDSLPISFKEFHSMHEIQYGLPSPGLEAAQTLSPIYPSIHPARLDVGDRAIS